MFKQIMKYTLAAVVWKRYRALIIATVLLFIYFWLVGKVHQDYVAFSEMKNSVDHLGTSFTIKWLFLGLGQGIYLIFIAFWRRAPKASKIKKDNLPRPTRNVPAKQDDTPREEEAAVFQNLREKPKLRSRSDLIIEKYPKK